MDKFIKYHHKGQVKKNLIALTKSFCAQQCTCVCGYVSGFYPTQKSAFERVFEHVKTMNQYDYTFNNL